MHYPEDKLDKKVEKLYRKNKVFRKLFDLMFDDFGWAATEINKDIMKIWNVVRKK